MADPSRTKVGALLVAFAATAGGSAEAQVRCMYEGNFYDNESVRCQAGVQQRCVEGSWRPLGLGCAADEAGAAGMRENPGVNAPSVNAPPSPADPRVGEPPPPRQPAPVVPRF